MANFKDPIHHRRALSLLKTQEPHPKPQVITCKRFKNSDARLLSSYLADSGAVKTQTSA